VQAADVTTITSAIGTTALAGMEIPRMSPPTTRANAEASAPFAITGSERPRKSGTRFAGVTSTYPRVCCQRSPSIVWPIAKMQGIAVYWSALPMT
jgi:hypothetical protein